VWDYAGDGYVHRLIQVSDIFLSFHHDSFIMIPFQNRADGKLVELPSASAMTPSFTTLGASSTSTSDTNSGGRGMGPSPADALAAEKVEAIGIEYSYLLTSQLDSQRAYYEELQTRYIHELEELRERLASVEVQASTTREAQERESQESKSLEERATKAEARAERSMQLARKFEKDLKDERAVSQGLMETIAALKTHGEAASKETADMRKELQEVRDQMRDVLFYLEARDKIEQGGGEGTIGEAAGGSLSIATSQVLAEVPHAPSRKRPKKKKT